jgi:hypothetical protein
MAALTQVPNAVAANEVPDLGPLIDISGPLPATAADLPETPDLVFTTPAGLVCRKSHGKVTHIVACQGRFPGTAPSTRSVSLTAVSARGDGPALFLPTAADGLRGDPARVPAITLGIGQKIVFWDFSPTESLACGIPLGTDVVCVLKAAHENGPKNDGPAVTHGFVISAPQSEAF